MANWEGGFASMTMTGMLASIFKQNPMDYLSQNKVTDDVMFRQYAASLFAILQPVGLGLMVFSCIVLVIRYSIAKKTDRKNQLLGPLITKMVISTMIGGFVYLVNMVYYIVDALAASVVI